MALKKEILKANKVLAGLTDEQIAAIETLSSNDENTVIGQRIGDIYREMDGKIATITGVQRNGDEKTYNYLERAATTLKDTSAQVATISKQVDDLTKEKTRLEKVIADGNGDTETKKALEQAKKDVSAITKQYNDLKNDHDKAVENHKSELFNVSVENVLNVATSGIKFKGDLSPAVTNVLLGQAMAKIKAMTPEYIDDGKGGKTLAFKDETGAIMRNPENQLNPFTANDLLTKELRTMGVLDEGKQRQGAGTKPSAGGGESLSIIDVSGSKTRVEANEIATQQLLSKGLTVGSDQFDAEMGQIWKDNNIAALPEK